MKKLIICFMGLLAITACEFNDKVDNFSIGGLDTLNLDSVVVVDEICTNDDYYDSTLQEWVGPRADRLNGIDLSPVE